jgi:hypothetical protein
MHGFGSQCGDALCASLTLASELMARVLQHCLPESQTLDSKRSVSMKSIQCTQAQAPSTAKKQTQLRTNVRAGRGELKYLNLTGFVEGSL